MVILKHTTHKAIDQQNNGVWEVNETETIDSDKGRDVVGVI